MSEDAFDNMHTCAYYADPPCSKCAERSIETCQACGTQGEWVIREHETLGGMLTCIRLRAEELGADDLVATVDITRDWITLTRDRMLGLSTTGLDL